MKKPFISCPVCDAFLDKLLARKAAGKRMYLPISKEIKYMALLCYNPNHIDLDGRFRDPNNLPQINLKI